MECSSSRAIMSHRPLRKNPARWSGRLKGRAMVDGRMNFWNASDVVQLICKHLC